MWPKSKSYPSLNLHRVLVSTRTYILGEIMQKYIPCITGSRVRLGRAVLSNLGYGHGADISLPVISEDGRVRLISAEAARRMGIFLWYSDIYYCPDKGGTRWIWHRGLQCVHSDILE